MDTKLTNELRNVAPAAAALTTEQIAAVAFAYEFLGECRTGNGKDHASVLRAFLDMSHVVPAAAAPHVLRYSWTKTGMKGDADGVWVMASDAAAQPDHIGEASEMVAAARPDDHIADARKLVTAAQGVDWLLYEHDDGRYAVAQTAEDATFTRGEPAWHRVGPVTIYGRAAVAPPDGRNADYVVTLHGSSDAHGIHEEAKPCAHCGQSPSWHAAWTPDDGEIMSWFTSDWDEDTQECRIAEYHFVQGAKEALKRASMQTVAPAVAAPLDSLAKRATRAAAAWVSPDTPVSTALAYREGYIAGVRSQTGAVQPDAPLCPNGEVWNPNPDVIIDDQEHGPRMVPRTGMSEDMPDAEAQPDERTAVPQAGATLTPEAILDAFKHAGMNLDPTPNALYTVRGQHAQLIEGARALLASAPTEQRMSDAARDVLAERARQFSEEGFALDHDDQHEPGTLAMAAASYAVAASYASANLFPMPKGKPPTSWPWDKKWWKPGDARRDLIKAGALILAEIERIDRA